GGGRGRGEMGWVGGGGDRALAAHVTGLLLGRQLVFEMNAGGARFDVGLHDLMRVKRPAEARLGVGDDRSEPMMARAAFGMLDLVGQAQCLIDAPAEIWSGIGGCKALMCEIALRSG